MWAEHIMSEPSFRRRAGDPSGFQFDIRLNWSRSIPMSCVEDVSVAIDGEIVDPLTLTLAQGGEMLSLRDWAGRDDVWWHVLGPSTVSATTARPLAAGSHTITFELRVRVPSFPPGADGVWPTRFNRVTVTEELS
jgi:hypothetical protein